MFVPIYKRDEKDTGDRLAKKLSWILIERVDLKLFHFVIFLATYVYMQFEFYNHFSEDSSQPTRTVYMHRQGESATKVKNIVIAIYIPF